MLSLITYIPVGNSRAITCLLRLDLDHFESQLDSPRLMQRFLNMKLDFQGCAVYFVTLLMIGAGFLPEHMAVAASAEITPFKVTYNLKYRIAKAKMTLNVSAHDSGGYNIDSNTKAEGVAKLVITKPIIEHAEFNIVDGVVQAVSYELNDGSEKSNEDVKIAYNWADSRANMQSEKGEEVKSLTAETMDQLVMQAAAVLAIKNGTEEFTFRQLNPGIDAQTITYSKMGEEILKTSLGELNTVKYSRKREGSSRENHFWYSIEHDYVPVQLEQVKGNKSVYKATLNSLEQ